MKTHKRRADTIKPGDVIMPPSREVSLWMRRTIKERGLTDEALLLTVQKVEEGSPDKTGRWLLFTTMHSSEWNSNRSTIPYAFRFKARPETPWICAVNELEVA